MPNVRILCFAGSTRTDSFNKKLAKLAAAAAVDCGAEVTLIDLRDFPLPLFDEDLEATSGMPEQATRLKQLFLSHNGLIVCSPEYNSSVSAVLKNAIDWVSRRSPGEPMKAAFLGKVAGLLSASPGALGGLRGLVHLRSILQNIGILVMPDQYALVNAHQAFGPEGQLTDANQQKTIVGQMQSLVRTIERLNASPAV